MNDVKMRHLFILLVLLSFMTGCAGIQTPVGTYRFTSDTQEKPKAKAKEPSSFEKETGLRPAVGTLMFIGGIAMLITLPVTAAAETNDPVMPLVIFGSGLALWGAAGIVYFAE